MAKSVIVEGKTTNEAIEKGLKQLKVSKNMVDIKVIESEEKRSFFSILTPRVVKVELTVKEESINTQNSSINRKEPREIKQPTQNDLDIAKQELEVFLDQFLKTVSDKSDYTITEKDNNIEVLINDENIGFLIGYRGETLYAFQTILSSVANTKTQNRVRIILDIAGYKEKRIKTVENLADRLAKTVVRTNKNITLEPMPSYERKIIHSRLQDNSKVTTRSIGEEPHRRVVIALKKKKNRRSKVRF